ncbi:MAG TPA: class I fructose-bisphosphate aldolase [Candidatus Paceibacterota bacterium]|nr:class I fructose-bisphosphate aldolase [Candidatus Paceibacterota bacterium]
MNVQELNRVARAIVEDGKGILAADESTSTIEKRLAKINLPSTEENRRAYREMLFTTPGFGEYISGVILYDETIRQSASDGRSFIKVLEEAGVMPGIKVDEGTVPMDNSPDEKNTKGLAGLPQRLAEYFTMGAEFAKWRAVYIISETLPSEANIRQNAQDLAEYAMACQEAGIVPIVEPEVLMDGPHSMARCEDVSRQVLKAVFEEIKNAGVALEGMILKTNMIVPGSESGEKATPEQIAEATLRVFHDVLPDELPGQAFLSGGQSEIEATANLNAMNARGPHPWKLTFSYGRALQDSALKTWGGKQENVSAAQQVFLKRAQMNSLAARGEYFGE